MSVSLEMIRDGLASVQAELRRVDAEREALQQINFAWQKLLMLGGPAPDPTLPPAIEEEIEAMLAAPEPAQPPRSLAPAGSGTVYYSKSHDLWKGSVMRDGKRSKSVYAKTEAEARAKLDALIATLSGAEPAAGPTCTTCGKPTERPPQAKYCAPCGVEAHKASQKRRPVATTSEIGSKVDPGEKPLILLPAFRQSPSPDGQNEPEQPQMLPQHEWDALLATLSGAEPDSTAATTDVDGGTRGLDPAAGVVASTSSAPERVLGLSFDNCKAIWRGQVMHNGKTNTVYSKDRDECLRKLNLLRVSLGLPHAGRPAKPKPKPGPKLCQICQAPIDRPRGNARYCMAHSIATSRARQGRPAADSDQTPPSALIGAREIAIAHPVGPDGAYAAWKVEATGTAYPAFRDWFAKQAKPTLAAWREHLRVEAMFARLDGAA